MVWSSKEEWDRVCYSDVASLSLWEDSLWCTRSNQFDIISKPQYQEHILLEFSRLRCNWERSTANTWPLATYRIRYRKSNREQANLRNALISIKQQWRKSGYKASS
jgi:hypothetical protein